MRYDHPRASVSMNHKRERASSVNGSALLWISILLFFLFGATYAQKEQAVPVTASTAVQKTVPIQIRTFGNVEAFSSISVKAKVDGELMKVFFQEGQEVEEGDPLFTIDPRPYQAALKEAEARLARDRSLAEKAESDLQRYDTLFNEGVVSREQYDAAISGAEALRATIDADRAVLENAELRLSYCFIHSPITGRTGSLLVDRGNLIKANDDNAMVVIHQIQPIFVNFKIAEQYLPDITRRMKQGKLMVEAIIPDEKDHPADGTLTFLDNEVDRRTGTIKLKGTFANREKILWPGQFVDVALTLGERTDAVVVPSQAVQTGQDGNFIYVVQSDLTVVSRPVVAGFTVEGETVIEKGVEPGEKVVLEGQLRLVPGSRVEIKSAPQEDKAKNP